MAKCGSTNVSRGKLLSVGRDTSVVFEPEGICSSSWSISGGVDLSSDRWSSFACLDCGLVWDYLRPDELKKFISTHSGGSDKEDVKSDKQGAYALYSEGVRLEAEGDMAGALAKYEAVMKEFPGTGAAGDAEISIQNLSDKSS